MLIKLFKLGLQWKIIDGNGIVVGKVYSKNPFSMDKKICDLLHNEQFKTSIKYNSNENQYCIYKENQLIVAADIEFNQASSHVSTMYEKTKVKSIRFIYRNNKYAVRTKQLNVYEILQNDQIIGEIYHTLQMIQLDIKTTLHWSIYLWIAIVILSYYQLHEEDIIAV